MSFNLYFLRNHVFNWCFDYFEGAFEELFLIILTLVLCSFLPPCFGVPGQI